MRAFIQVIETKDCTPAANSKRVSEGVGMLGKQLRLNEDRQSALEHAGLRSRRGQGSVSDQHHPQARAGLDDTEMGRDPVAPPLVVSKLIGQHPVPRRGQVSRAASPREVRRQRVPAGLSGENIPTFAGSSGIVDALRHVSPRPARNAARPQRRGDSGHLEAGQSTPTSTPCWSTPSFDVIRRDGLESPEMADQPEPDASVEVSIDHDDLSLGSSGGASGSAPDLV